MEKYIGIDIGGTRTKAILCEESGHCLEKFEIPTRDAVEPGGQSAFAQDVKQLIARIGKTHGPVAGVGIAAPGLTDKEESRIVAMPERLVALNHLHWTEYLGIPTKVMNDARAALLGEIWLGNAKGKKDVVLLTLGTGVGGAASVDGNILMGHIGRAACLGHICLNVDGPQGITRIPGSLEDAVGESTVAKRTEGLFPNTHELVKAYRTGDERAASIWLRSIRYLACGIASIINTLDPEVVLLGGGISKAGDSLTAPLVRELDSIEWRPNAHQVTLLRTKLGELSGAYGTARKAILSSQS